MPDKGKGTGKNTEALKLRWSSKDHFLSIA
jgi:hypothetical protein